MKQVIVNLDNIVDQVVTNNVAVANANQAISDAEALLVTANSTLSEAESAVQDAQNEVVLASNFATMAEDKANVAEGYAMDAAGHLVAVQGLKNDTLTAKNAAEQAVIDAGNVVTTTLEVYTNQAIASAADADAAKTAAELARDEASTVTSSVTGVVTEAQKTQAEVTELLAAARRVYDDFDDRYLWGHSDDPITDNDGDDIVDGALYWNTVFKEIRVFDQVNLIWKPISAASGALLAIQNLGDLSNTTEARNNLDVYSKAEIPAIISAGLANADADLGAQVTGVLI
jgi:hypothetical protein